MNPSDRLEQLGFKPELTCATNVRNLEQSIKWYSQKLGFRLLYKTEEIGWCELSTPVPGTNLGLSEVEDPKVHGTVLTWSVEDIAHTRQLLEQAGVQFAGETDTIPGLAMLASFYDPDGNTYMLAQNLS